MELDPTCFLTMRERANGPEKPKRKKYKELAKLLTAHVMKVMENVKVKFSFIKIRKTTQKEETHSKLRLKGN